MEDAEVPITMYLLMQLQGVANKLVNRRYEGTGRDGGRVMVDHRELDELFELVEEIRGEARTLPGRGHI